MSPWMEPGFISQEFYHQASRELVPRVQQVVGETRTTQKVGMGPAGHSAGGLLRGPPLQVLAAQCGSRLQLQLLLETEQQGILTPLWAVPSGILGGPSSLLPRHVCSPHDFQGCCKVP